MEKRNMIIAVGIVAILIVAAVGFALASSGGDNPPDKTTITQKGSDTMLELATAWAEQFQTEDANVTVEVAGGGSGVGITALKNKQTDIAQSSRSIKASEIADCVANGVNPVEFKVAIDGIAIITHSSNTITNLTVEQLRGIFNGTITNWQSVGGPNLAITLYGRQSTSGTYSYFKEHILVNGNYSESMQMMTGNSAIVDAVKIDNGGVGYVGIGYISGVSGIDVLSIKKDSSSPAYAPTNETAVLSGKYNIARYLFLYTDGVPTGAVKDWMDWILTADKGQSVASDIGFYALPWYDVEEGKGKLGGMAAATVQQKGSDTMLELATAWAEQFGQNDSWITVEVAGGGSGVGITALKNKQTDIAQSSRLIKATEIADCIANGVNPVEFAVAVDGIAIITHASNNVTTLTTPQLRGIYNGTITNWNQVGGPNLAITLYGRQSTSGTYAYFKEHVLVNGNYSVDMQMMTGNAAIVDAVKIDSGGIGYVGIGYVNGVTGIDVLMIKKTSALPAYSPLDATAVLNGSYDIARYLYLYTDGTPEGAIWHWMNWILDANKGQKVAGAIGFYALPSDVLASQRAKLGF